MALFTLHDQEIAMTVTQHAGPTYIFKLYVDGDMRDHTTNLNVPKDWCTVARASVTNAQGQRRELELQVKKAGFFSGYDYHYRFRYEGEIVHE